MRDQIISEISEAKNLNQIIVSFNNLCKQLRTEHPKIGYVAGIIFSEGPEHIQKNIQKLTKYTELLRQINNFPIFSSVDLFYDNTFYEQIEDTKLPYIKRRAAFINFYREILGNNYITDIFMTPRWEMSEGATDEHETGKKYGLTIHYVGDLSM